MFYDIILREPRKKSGKFIYLFRYMTKEDVINISKSYKGNFKNDCMIIQSRTEERLYNR